MSIATEPGPEFSLACKVNGRAVETRVAVRQHLADFLRERLGLTGTRLGCEHGSCGACTVLVDGSPVRGCLMLAIQADGAAIETVEGLTETGAIADLQAAFVARNALQCGFCTAGILVTASALLRAALTSARDPRDEVREFLSGNFCRCTGYHAIVDAVSATLPKGASHA